MKPVTAGSWEKRCAALYQVIGCLAHCTDLFDSVDVQRALDVACGRGDVDSLLPWPRDPQLFKTGTESATGAAK